MVSAGNGGLGPLTLRIGYSAAAVAASPPSGDPGGGLHRASPRERGGGGPAGGPTHRLTGAIYRPAACNPSLPTLLRRRGVAKRREGGRQNVTRARRVPPTPRHRHLRAGAGETEKGACEDWATARAWREKSGRRPRSAPTSSRACAHTFTSLSLFFAFFLSPISFLALL